MARRRCIDIVRKLFTENGLFFYMVYFQDEGVAEAELEADVRDNDPQALLFLVGRCAGRRAGRWTRSTAIRLLHRLIDPPKFPAWLTDQDIDYLVKEFEGSGFRGPLNRYRNFHRDFAAAAKYAGKKIEQPALFMAGASGHGGIRMFGRDVETKHAPALRRPARLPHDRGAGHWNQQEKPGGDEQAAAGLAEGALGRAGRSTNRPKSAPSPALPRTRH